MKKIMFAGMAATAFALVAPAEAATITLGFDGVTNTCGICGGGPMFPASIVEQGIVVGNTPASLGGGDIHLDAAGTSFSDKVSFTAAGPFSLLGLDLAGFGSGLVKTVFDPATNATTITKLAFQNVLFQGFRSGLAVASLYFSTGTDPQNFSLSFGSAFSNLDKLVISALSPSLPRDTPTTQYGCLSPECGHFSIDNVKLASVSAVPVPPAIWMLGAGLLLLGAARRRNIPKAQG